VRAFLLAISLLAAGELVAQGPGTGNREQGTGATRRSEQSAPGSRFPVPSSQLAPRGSELTVYLMTMGHGDRVWERFGHNAIRIVDASRGTDSLYNWGTFDFQQPNFLGRFLTGNTLYWMQAEGMAQTLENYRFWNRSVWTQELDLTPEERANLRDFIVWNGRPENRYYRYDYYLDNCSTRVRDILDRVIGGQLRAATEPRLTNTTYRFHTQRLLQFDRAVAAGTNIGLGQLADRPISAWAEMFLPARMREHVRGIQVRRSDGSTRPLVKSEQELFAAQRGPEPAQPPGITILYLAIGVTLAVLFALLVRGANAGKHAARVTFATLTTIWAALNGILGVILIVGWTATRHVFMVRNENLLQFDPLSLALAVVLPLAIMRGRSVRAAQRLSTVIAAIALVGLAAKLLPWFFQVNGAVIALALPVHLTLAWSVRALSAARVTRPVPPDAAARALASRPAA